jgi:excisionase family DNA binding protein
MARAKKQSQVQPLLLTVAEVADSLRVCHRTVYNLMASDGLPWVLVGGSRRVYLGTAKQKSLKERTFRAC